MARGYRTKYVETFEANPNLMQNWVEFRSAIAARMAMFPGALYPEQVLFEVVRHFESEAHKWQVQREMDAACLKALNERKRGKR